MKPGSIARDAPPVLAVTLAVGLAHALGLRDSWWAAISAFVIVQSDSDGSMPRGILRVVGTACGAQQPVRMAGGTRADDEVHVDLRLAQRHAMPGGIAVAVMAALFCWHDLHALAQAMVTAIAVLIVPPGASSAAQARRRMLQRLAGCLLAAALGLAMLPFVGGHPLACQLTLCAGVWLGARMQASGGQWRYAAIQFTVAFLMVFVQDSGWHAHVEAAAGRFAGIAIGVALMTTVLLSIDGIRAISRGARHAQ